MSVEFNEPTAYVRTRTEEGSAFSRFFMKLGLVKSPTGAQILMFFVALILIICAGYLFRIANEKPPAPTPAQVVL